MNGKYREPLVYPDGTFFCLGCLETLSQELLGPDILKRYCRDCCERLLAEYERLDNRENQKKWGPPGWVPKVSPVPAKGHQKPSNQNLARKKARHHPLDDTVLFDDRSAGEKELQRRLL